MKRNELLSKYRYQVPDQKKKRVIIHTDAKNEADDQFAIVHHLLTPYLDVKGIIGAHFEGKYEFWFAKNEQHLRGTSMQQSVDEIKKVLEIMELEDISVWGGAKRGLDQKVDYVKDFLGSDGNPIPEKREELLKLLPASEGADEIIKEAMKDDSRQLFVTCLGSITDIAIAFLREPAIAKRMTMIWIGGGVYPKGNLEFNLFQDIRAAQILFASPLNIWQVPQSTYTQMMTSLAELEYKVLPQGKIGRYLFEQMEEFNRYMAEGWPHGENWCIGDMATVAVLMNEGMDGVEYITRKAPKINLEETYSENPTGKEIRVYQRLSSRMAFEDFFSKLALLYGVQ